MCNNKHKSQKLRPVTPNKSDANHILVARTDTQAMGTSVLNNIICSNVMIRTVMTTVSCNGCRVLEKISTILQVKSFEAAGSCRPNPGRVKFRLTRLPIGHAFGYCSNTDDSDEQVKVGMLS